MDAVLMPNIDDDTLKPPLRLMWMSELAAEMALIEAALPPAKRLHMHDPDEWNAVMKAFLKCLPQRTEIGAGEAINFPLSKQAAGAIHGQIGQLRKGMDQAKRHGGGQFPQTHLLLVPHMLRTRYALLLGHGKLPLVWVQAI